MRSDAHYSRWPSSPLMSQCSTPTTKKSHSFNDKHSWHDCSHSNGTVLSNQLSASFAALSQCYQNVGQNKHIKWCYPETSESLSKCAQPLNGSLLCANSRSPHSSRTPSRALAVSTHIPDIKINNPESANSETPKRSRKKHNTNAKRQRSQYRTNMSRAKRKQKHNKHKLKYTNVSQKTYA